jgi:hypothetical protein
MQRSPYLTTWSTYSFSKRDQKGEVKYIFIVDCSITFYMASTVLQGDAQCKVCKQDRLCPKNQDGLVPVVGCIPQEGTVLKDTFKTFIVLGRF